MQRGRRNMLYKKTPYGVLRLKNGLRLGCDNDLKVREKESLTLTCPRPHLIECPYGVINIPKRKPVRLKHFEIKIAQYTQCP